MKRDMDLVRTILLEIEESDNTRGYLNLEIDDVDEETVSYHVKLMAEADLIEAMNLTDSRGFDWRPVSLTWEGHEFLDSAKNETIWNKAKSSVLSKTGSLTFEAMKISLGAIIKQALLPE